jgi:2-beta-glucuronyltransferase
VFTGHVFNSGRKASVHFISEALIKRGWHLVFVTTGLSLISVFKRDYRLKYIKDDDINAIVTRGPNLEAFVWFTSFHPINLRSATLNDFTSPLFLRYGRLPLGKLGSMLPRADMAIIESGPGLLLFKRLRKANPAIKIVYNVSDDLRVICTHPVLWRVESEFLEQFDLIRCPSRCLRERFPPGVNAKVIHHGVDRSAFEQNVGDPYEGSGRVRVVSIGDMLFDKTAVLAAAEMFPDLEFHMIGNIEPFIEAQNVTFYGEMAFEKTVAYLKHADIGLAPYAWREGAEYLCESSLKLIQYTYCRLPIVTAEFACAGRSHAFGYKPGDRESIRRALIEARDCDRQAIGCNDVISSWDEVAAAIEREAFCARARGHAQ